MRIIDAHAHLLDEPGYLEKLLSTIEKCGISNCCLSGIGPLFGCMDDHAVRSAFAAYPDRIIGAVFIRPGVDGVEKIDWAYDEGFRMIKVTTPRLPYNDPSFFALWERAMKYNMPVLFHTGIVAPGLEAPGEMISSWNMHPMRIEPITREFPELGVIIAHLGVHWNADAAELARMRPNAYVDLTGAAHGWRARADREGMDKWLWWPGAFEKVVFGTDVHFSKIGQILSQDSDRLDKLKIDQDIRRKIFSGNILRLLHIES